MDKLDRLGWAAGTSFVSFGVRVGVRTNRLDGLKGLAAALPPDFEVSDDPEDILVNGRSLSDSSTRRTFVLLGDPSLPVRPLSLGPAGEPEGPSGCAIGTGRRTSPSFGTLLGLLLGAPFFRRRNSRTT